MTYADYEWYLKQDLSQYAGQWVAIIDKKIVANDKDAAKVIQEAKRKCPDKKPSITKVNNQLSIFHS
ncbi:MAG TPA: DUF5678 domain-containing protein [Candidatus Nanoarchaeia archaeon]|nr:DUF5678 domain-containing protein [Candidatus Nanoarchaeia archaeon]